MNNLQILKLFFDCVGVFIIVWLSIENMKLKKELKEVINEHSKNLDIMSAIETVTKKIADCASKAKSSVSGIDVYTNDIEHHVDFIKSYNEHIQKQIKRFYK